MSGPRSSRVRRCASAHRWLVIDAARMAVELGRRRSRPAAIAGSRKPRLRDRARRHFLTHNVEVARRARRGRRRRRARSSSRQCTSAAKTASSSSHVGDLIQRLAPNVNVRVAQGASQSSAVARFLANGAAKRQDAVSRYGLRIVRKPRHSSRQRETGSHSVRHVSVALFIPCMNPSHHLSAAPRTTALLLSSSHFRAFVVSDR